MKKYYLNNFNYIKVFKKMSVSSKIVTQMIYGDAFGIIMKLSIFKYMFKIPDLRKRILFLMSRQLTKCASYLQIFINIPITQKLLTNFLMVLK